MYFDYQNEDFYLLPRTEVNIFDDKNMPIQLWCYHIKIYEFFCDNIVATSVMTEGVPNHEIKITLDGEINFNYLCKLGDKIYESNVNNMPIDIICTSKYRNAKYLDIMYCNVVFRGVTYDEDFCQSNMVLKCGDIT